MQPLLLGVHWVCAHTCATSPKSTTADIQQRDMRHPASASKVVCVPCPLAHPFARATSPPSRILVFPTPSTTPPQVAVAVMRSFKGRWGEEPEQTAQRMAKALHSDWGVGLAACDNGALLLLSVDDRQVSGVVVKDGQ